MKQTLYNIKATLNTVTVSGEANLDKLLGCIQAITGLIVQLEKEEQHADDHAE